MQPLSGEGRQLALSLQRGVGLLEPIRTGLEWARSTAAGPTILILSLATVLSACSDPGPTLSSEGRVFRQMDDFLGGYWQRPIPLQGSPPDTFSPLDTSLDPATCGNCHPQQYADWQTTVHSGAYSPGLSGQLVNWEANSYQFVRDCLVCHAPLSEQSAQVPDTSGTLVSNPYFDSSLQHRGLVCAACHVRGWNRYGPPRRDGSVEPSPAGSPHGGVTRTPFFEDSRFCAGCHQFEFPAPNGKSLQNTYSEWASSRYAAEGIGCQDCHMPDRRHLWRGVHDSTMVRNGVTIELTKDVSDGVALRVTNSGTGHRFPTYVTPEIWLRIELLDSERRAMDGATVELPLRRVVGSGSGGWTEVSDTRLPPDSSVTLTVAVDQSDARFARGTVTVYPDVFYEGQFWGMLLQELSDTSRALISEAHRRAGASVMVIYDETVPVGRADSGCGANCNQ